MKMARESIGNNLKEFVRNSALWYGGKCLILLALILCLFAGCAMADSPKATETGQNASMADESGNKSITAQIQGELQWSENFSWSYCPEESNENGNGAEEIGYFTQNTGFKNAVGSIRRDDARVLVFRQELGDTPFYAQIEEEIEKHSRCLINLVGNTELTLAIRMEAKDYYELHLQQDGVIYTLRGTGLDKGEWYQFLEELLLTADLHWGERDAYTDTVFPMFTDDHRYSEGDCWWLQFDGELLPIKWYDLVSCNICEDGLRICYMQYNRQEEESFAAECLLQHGQELPTFETEAALFDWFKEKNPSIQSYAAYSEEEVFNSARFDNENTARALEKTPYRKITTGEGQELLYLTYESRYYEFCFDRTWGDIWSCPFDYYALRRILGIGWRRYIGFEVTVSGSGLINRYDNLKEKYYLQQEMGEDIFSFAVEYVYQPGDDEREPEEIGRLWRISVYRNGESEPFQEIEVESAAFQECPVSFYDFNADGFQDLIVYYYYGANGGSESRYLWSPSRESFVYFPDLEYYGSYYVDPETRRFHIHYHGSAISGSDEVYQWKNEMDCELIKDITYYPASFDSAESMVIKVTRYDGGREEILSDYTYSREEYEARHDDIWGIFREDFVWEQEVTVDGETYILRYAQSPLEDMPPTWGEKYSGRLYIFREDTYLLSVWESEIIDPWSRMEWAEKDEEKWPWSIRPEDGEEKYLIIHYRNPLTGEEDGSWGIPVSSIPYTEWDTTSP